MIMMIRMSMSQSIHYDDDDDDGGDDDDDDDDDENEVGHNEFDEEL